MTKHPVETERQVEEWPEEILLSKNERGELLPGWLLVREYARYPRCEHRVFVPISQLREAEAGADRYLCEREEARSGEDHWKAQRDAALRLLLWVIADLLPVEER